MDEAETLFPWYAVVNSCCTTRPPFLGGRGRLYTPVEIIGHIYTPGVLLGDFTNSTLFCIQTKYFVNMRWKAALKVHLLNTCT
jgi:hypothetical protein